ncbi:Crp/Fnr family transcriptional regulator [Actinoplanes sp. N902-109]|uniref:Crp/Fnr family transcriptional regulator n=1 Tax=Actinoplanes sp. (strain N902-109) TaxID=649831 RepID=UPI0003293F70|nr:Crp/Fnr family transcriptional regulator [Actinoplanes sp. N902-109]AGL18768.1 Crp/Fnr family transcriptional regulator [Actinoplanes sp. N902-109]
MLDLLTPQDRGDLLRAGTPRTYEPGDVLMHEGDRTAFAMILRTGHTIVSVSTAQGNRLVLALRGPGDLLGELAALDGEARSATVTALVPVEAVVVPVEQFRRLLLTRPAAAQVVLRTLGTRLRDSDAARRELVAATLLQRVAKILGQLADRAGRPTPEGVLIDLPLPQHELAGLAGATREGTAKALAVLRAGGAVQTRPRQTFVTDRALLDAVAGL